MASHDTEQLRSQLRELVGEQAVNTAADTLVQYGTDWTKLYPPNPAAIVFPKTLSDVQKLVQWANQASVALVPSGGRTGLSGGAVAAQHEVVVSFDAMHQISDFNAVDRTVRCEAGVVTQALQEYATAHDLYFPVSFASQGSSQIGGNIATNAGGVKVLRYGATRDWVAGLTVVTGKGDIIELNKGLVKNATGYDLRHLFIGSEGTLGFIVSAVLRLTAKPRPTSVMVLGVDTFPHIMALLQAFQGKVALTAFEFFSEAALSRVVAKHQLQRPFESTTPYYALIEFEQMSDQSEDIALSIFEACAEKGWISDGVISQSDQQVQDLWRLREDIGETLAEETPYKNDLSVLTSEVPAFLEEFDALTRELYPDFEVVCFGHIGDGNIHVNILKPHNVPLEDFKVKCEASNEKVFALTEKFHGSVSAEHGIGLLKKPYLHYSRSAEEVDYLRSIKKVFDPNGIMNPGKIFD